MNPISEKTTYYQLVDENCRHFPEVVKTFNERIAPIYGNQTSALTKIGKAEGRYCEMLFDGSLPKGLIVYKKDLEENKSLELKTLIVLNPEQDSGKGYGSELMRRVESVAKERLASNIAVTVSSERPEAGAFFKKKGFVTQKTCPDLYKQGSTEEFLSKPLSDLIKKRKKESETSIPEGKTPRTEANVSQSQQVESNKTTSSRQDPLTFNGNKHTCTLGGRYIHQIQSGEKTFEGRINSGLFKEIQPGDKVEWFSQNASVTTGIVSKQSFRTFDNMLDTVGYKKMIPTARSFNEAVGEYERIPGYVDRAYRSGVVALGLQVLPEAKRNTR